MSEFGKNCNKTAIMYTCLIKKMLNFEKLVIFLFIFYKIADIIYRILQSDLEFSAGNRQNGAVMSPLLRC